jgi:hypothetical protein
MDGYGQMPVTGQARPGRQIKNQREINMISEPRRAPTPAVAEPPIASAFLVQAQTSHYPKDNGGIRPAAWEIREINSLRNASGNAAASRRPAGIADHG